MLEQLHLAGGKVLVLQDVEFQTRRLGEPAIRARQLALGLLDILNRALIRHDLAHGQEVQRFGAAFVDLVLRVDHVPDDAVTVIIPIDVAR